MPEISCSTQRNHHRISVCFGDHRRRVRKHFRRLIRRNHTGKVRYLPRSAFSLCSPLGSRSLSVSISAVVQTSTDRNRAECSVRRTIFGKGRNEAADDDLVGFEQLIRCLGHATEVLAVVMDTATEILRGAMLDVAAVEAGDCVPPLMNLLSRVIAPDSYVMCVLSAFRGGAIPSKS